MGLIFGGRKIEPIIAGCFLVPAGPFIRAAFGAGSCICGHVGPAIGAFEGCSGSFHIPIQRPTPPLFKALPGGFGVMASSLKADCFECSNCGFGSSGFPTFFDQSAFWNFPLYL